MHNRPTGPKAVPPWRRPPEPPGPPSGRSRSHLTERTQGLIEAHQRNVSQRRGGKHARRRTKSIHRGLLEVLLTRLNQLLSFLVEGRSVYERRAAQVQDRLDWLNVATNFPADKTLVLPGLRSVADDWESIESEGIVESVYVNTDLEEEEDDRPEDPDRPFGSNGIQETEGSGSLRGFFNGSVIISTTHSVSDGSSAIFASKT